MDVSKSLRWLVLLAIVGCDAPPKADASRTASEKWAEPKAPADAEEAKGDDGAKTIAEAKEDAKTPAEAVKRPEVQSLIHFYIDNAGVLANEVGFISMTDEEYNTQRKQFDQFTETHKTGTP